MCTIVVDNMALSSSDNLPSYRPDSHHSSYDGSLYLNVTSKFYTEVLHQTLIPTADLWCKTLSRIKLDLVLHRT